MAPSHRVILVISLLSSRFVAPCVAQQPTGPAMLEGLLNSEEAQAPAATTTVAAAKGLAGVVVRPKDGVQHPDLDKAWVDYEAAVAKVTESIKAAINKQFDAASAKGDLDAAEKWQVLGEKFEKAGELPIESETKAAVSRAVADYKKSREELTKAYEAVVKALTTEKKIAEAKAVRGEWLVISAAEKEAVAPSRTTKKEKDVEKLRKPVFLTDLEEQDVSVTPGWGRRFGKNGVTWDGKNAILVGGVVAKKGLSMHPANKGVSSVSYVVPANCFRFETDVAMADSSVGQRSPVVFEVVAGEQVLWKSQPLQGAGVSEACAITLKGAKTIVLRARCVGDNFGAHAVWVDPRFLRK